VSYQPPNWPPAPAPPPWAQQPPQQQPPAPLPGPQQPPGPVPGPPPGAPTAVPAGRRPVRIVVGLLLVLPALAMLALSYVWPAFWNLQKSFSAYRLNAGPAHGAGFANYRALFQGGGFLSAVGFSLTLALVPLLLVTVVAPALAWAAHRTGTVARWVVRVALALPLVAYAPTAMALGWALDHVNLKSENVYLKSAGDSRTALWLGSFGLVCSVGVTAYLATLRRRDAVRRTWPAAVVVGALLGLAVLAVAMQQLAYPYLLRRAAGPGAPRTPALLILEAFGERFDVGVAAAISTLLLILLGLAGLAAVALILGSRLRIEFDPRYRSAEQEAGWSTPRIVAAAGTAVALIAVLVVAGIGLWPWLSRLNSTAPLPGAGPLTLLRNTWLPPLLSTVVGVAVAVLAAFGIGALRPLGRFSELLLLPFAPWLFVGFAPLVTHAFLSTDHSRGNAFLSLVPASWVSIPALFIATLLVRGQAARLRATGGRGADAVVRAYVLPVLPMVLLLFGAVWIWQAQDLMWQEIMSNPADNPTVVMSLLTTTGLYDTRNVLGAVLPALLLTVLVVLAIAAQVGYLDRIAIRAGREE
jgi:ABC-type sugar transport system permease subunit